MGRRRDPVDALTPREREVLSLMAEGRSNAAIAGALTVTLGAVEKHTQRIFAKLGLRPYDPAHRRVQAVLRYLRSSGGSGWRAGGEGWRADRPGGSGGFAVVLGGCNGPERRGSQHLLRSVGLLVRALPVGGVTNADLAAQVVHLAHQEERVVERDERALAQTGREVLGVSPSFWGVATARNDGDLSIC